MLHIPRTFLAALFGFASEESVFCYYFLIFRTVKYRLNYLIYDYCTGNEMKYSLHRLLKTMTRSSSSSGALA